MYDSDSEEFDFGHDDHSNDDLSASSDSEEESDYDDDENNHPNDNKNNASSSNATTSSKKKNKKSSSSANDSNNNKNNKKKKQKTIEETYQKKSQLEHILLRPDTYIGSTEPLTQPMFVLNPTTKRIEQCDITYTPGFYKIFDEIIVNAADNKQRHPNSMDTLEVNIDAERGVISVMNNGKGIPVEMHREHDCYVPTLIFGHLLTVRSVCDSEIIFIMNAIAIVIAK